MLDPLPRWGAPPRPGPSGFPRISIPGLTQPFPVPRAPSPDDAIDAARLTLRLGALGRALDDLPREAKRFARWRAHRDAAGAQNRRAADAARKPDAAGAQKGNGRDAAGAQNKKHRDAAGAQDRKQRAGRFRRVWPLRPGRPPGGRLAHYDPDAWGGRKNIRDVDEILAHTHALARYALNPDTS